MTPAPATDGGSMGLATARIARLRFQYRTHHNSKLSSYPHHEGRAYARSHQLSIHTNLTSMVTIRATVLVAI
jgi:hypothetical protein